MFRNQSIDTKVINDFTTMTTNFQGDTTLNQSTREGEFHGDDGSTTEIPITRSTYIFVLCAALNSCNLGFDIGVSTTAGKLVEEDWDLSRIEREVFIGSINFWACTFKDRDDILFFVFRFRTI